jgi:hypothetical protein
MKWIKRKRQKHRRRKVERSSSKKIRKENSGYKKIYSTMSYNIKIKKSLKKKAGD